MLSNQLWQLHKRFGQREKNQQLYKYFYFYFAPAAFLVRVLLCVCVFFTSSYYSEGFASIYFCSLDQCPKGGMINFSFACFEEMLLFSAKLQQPQLYIRPVQQQCSGSHHQIPRSEQFRCVRLSRQFKLRERLWFPLSYFQKQSSSFPQSCCFSVVITCCWWCDHYYQFIPSIDISVRAPLYFYSGNIISKENK